MVLFAFIAGVLVGTAASRLALPLWRSAATLAWRRTSSEGAPYVHAAFVRAPYVRAGVLVASFAVAAGLLYLAVSSRQALEHPGKSAPASAGPAAKVPSGSAGTAKSAKSMDAEVAGLEARLARDGGTPADWTLLAQAYEFLGRPDDAKRARAKAGKPASGPVVWQMGATALTAAAAAAADTGTTTPASPALGRSGSTAATAASASSAASASPAGSASPAASAADLERRVAANPRDAQSWLALADVRRSQRDWAGARAAYMKVVDLRAMSAQSWADYADVLGSLAGGSLAGEAARAIDNALALDGTNPKALWLKASQANEEHRYTEALGWWKKLRAVLPSDSADARMVDSNIAEANSLATQGAVPAGLTTVATGGGASASGASVAVTGTVSLETGFAARVQPGATLFIYAKAADSPGPPLAVWRTTVGTWPVSFRLDDSMAMIPSRRLSQFDRVVIEARISRSGQATPATGDLYVTSQVLRPAAGTRLALVINREIG
jgi:cytochrome c-type biogenesis protein CcmH